MDRQLFQDLFVRRSQFAAEMLRHYGIEAEYEGALRDLADVISDYVSPVAVMLAPPPTDAIPAVTPPAPVADVKSAHRELLDVATEMYHALHSTHDGIAVPYSTTDPYGVVWNILERAGPILAELGAFDEPTPSEVYDGFGPHGEPDSIIRNGTDRTLYEHDPICDCERCRPGDPGDYEDANEAMV